MKILRLSEVIKKVGLSRSTIWRMEQSGEFPAKIKLGENSVGWSEDEIHEWLKFKIEESRREVGVWKKN